MIKKSIVAKLFLVIVLLFVFQTIIQTGFQKYFLADYYENEKTETVSKAFEESIEQFRESDTLEDKTDILEDFISMTNEPIVVFNGYFELHDAAYSVSYENVIIVEDENGEIFHLIVDQLIDPNLVDIEIDYNLIDEEITLYSFEEDGFVYPYSFTYKNFDYFTVSESEEDYFISEGAEIIETHGRIVDYYETIISDEMLNKLELLENKFLSESLDDYYELDDGGLYEYISDEVIIDGEKLYFLSMVSLQPINEVLEIQNRFQIYITFIMLLIIGVIAVFISKLIAKPIKEITSTAEAITEMNFEVKCDENRSDEIGILAKNINYLSNALKEKIVDLESANLLLEDEIEFERKQEQIRKEFIANVSHELKTPLGVISSYSEGIKDGISREKKDYYLDVIIDEVGKMNELIIDMLELSNLETRQTLNPLQKISLRRMIQNIMRPYEENRKANIAVDLEECLANVDVKKMELVLANLISNAFRYVDERKVINISLFENEEMSIFEIENSCEAISDDEINKVWDRFYRVEKSRSRSLGGNGLGLAIVKSILEMHGFEYEVKNTEIGVKFRILFLKSDNIG